MNEYGAYFELSGLLNNEEYHNNKNGFLLKLNNVRNAIVYKRENIREYICRIIIVT